MLPMLHIHDTEEHYERRIIETPSSLREPLLQWCHDDNIEDVSTCLEGYSGGMNGLGGVSARGWTPLAAMAHTTNWDEDSVTVLKNDQGQGGRRCIISFEGADVLFGDLSNFLFASSSSYCGKKKVQEGACVVLLILSG